VILYRISQHSFRDEPVKTEVFAHVTDRSSREGICDELFDAWNNGSGMECAEFRAENRAHRIHSLSVSDVVIFVDENKVDCDWWVCSRIGWTQISKDDYEKHEAKCIALNRRS
jgi:hypothetical protein